MQVIYSKQEAAEEAVTKYHNRLLDGQLMYVSLQQPSSYSTKSSKNSSSLNPNQESLKSNSSKISIDPSFIRQALFNPSNNTTNPCTISSETLNLEKFLIGIYLCFIIQNKREFRIKNYRNQRFNNE